MNYMPSCVWRMRAAAIRAAIMKSVVPLLFITVLLAGGVRQAHAVTQAQIDEILDKISQSGYQSLTEEEKRLLFEASKKLN